MQGAGYHSLRLLPQGVHGDIASCLVAINVSGLLRAMSYGSSGGRFKFRGIQGSPGALTGLIAFSATARTLLAESRSFEERRGCLLHPALLPGLTILSCGDYRGM